LHPLRGQGSLDGGEAVTTTKEVYRFKKGEKKHLDDIYFIQSLGENWWDYINCGNSRTAPSDDIIIRKDVTITITITMKD